MRNWFLFCFLAMAVAFAGCKEEYDDSGIRGDLSALEQRVAALEQLCEQMNTNISSLQTLVNAMQDGDYITNVAPVMQGSETVGYTINFLKAGVITIYNGKDGEKGEQGYGGEYVCFLLHGCMCLVYNDDSSGGFAPLVYVRDIEDDVVAFDGGGDIERSVSG